MITRFFEVIEDVLESTRCFREDHRLLWGLLKCGLILALVVGGLWVATLLWLNYWPWICGAIALFLFLFVLVHVVRTPTARPNNQPDLLVQILMIGMAIFALIYLNVKRQHQQEQQQRTTQLDRSEYP